MDERTVEPADRISGGRYTLQQIIGQGGSSTVYQAVDTVSGQRVALKRLRPSDDDEKTQRSRELFEHEFHTLSQLAHPRIVAALDYGQGDDLPFYTMELLDGGDLVERSPLPWRDACAVARDLCSALSLLHSRRLVYRDLSVRNVRCTSDGKAKLIDFGAMTPMGPTKIAVCTPSVAAPEVIHCQPLDGRADLYALGATLYHTLVGHSAYAARTFQQLHELWKHPPRAPSEWVPEIPKALDVLVMDLLQLDSHLRPASAAEVSQRLSAIAGLQSDEQLLSSQAYLTTPTLVGRAAQLEAIEAHLKRLLGSGKGSALLVRGALGSGRSRFLDTCGLRAKLSGLTVLHTSPADAPEKSYAAVHAIARQLLEVLPDETVRAAGPESAALSVLLPVLRHRLPRTAGDRSDADVQNHAPATLRSFFSRIASEKPLLIAIDDIERFDADSRALIALLAREARNQRFIVLATTEGDALTHTDADRLLSEACHHVTLDALEENETHALFASIFGDVPNLEGLVRRTHALAGGNPQNLMRLAQHLLDQNRVQCSAGTWILPEKVDDADLPATMAQALRATVARLDDESRALAEAMAQAPEQRFSVDECLTLTAHGNPARLFRSLNLLVAASIVVSTADGYALAAKSWVAPLSGSSGSDVHRRLARVYQQRGDGLQAARHLFSSGCDTEALDVLIAFADASTKETDASPQAYERLLTTLPDDWMEIFDEGIETCRKRGRPASELYALQRRIGGLLSQTSKCSNGTLAALARSLAHAAGLDIYASLDAATDPGQRLQRALAEATARHAQTPERERLLDPGAAIQHLSRTLIAAIGNFSRTLDVDEWRNMPSLTPLVPLSPAIALVDGLARGFDARLGGRFEEACAIYEAILRKLDAAQNTGLDPTYLYTVRAALVSIMGTLHAALGLPSSEQWALEVAKYPLYHGSTLAIRMLDRLWQGDALSAARLSRERELWRLEQPRQQSGDVLTLLWTLQAHAASDDLTQTRHCLTSIEQMATKLRTWQPIASWARGEYERIRGDHAAALVALDTALRRMEPGKHQIWPLASAARLKVLCEQEQYAEARAQGETYLASAIEHRLGYMANYIRMPLTLATAKLGDAESARRHVADTIASFDALGTRGLNLGIAYETAARVAACLGDSGEFERYSALCRQQYLRHQNPTLAAKYRRLINPTRRSQRPERATAEATDSVIRSQIESLIQTCSTSPERLRRAVELLVLSTGAQCGFLYGFVDGVPSLCAQTDAEPPPTHIDTAARNYLDCEVSDTDMTKVVDSEEIREAGSLPGFTMEWAAPQGGVFYQPHILTHRTADGIVLSGVVVLRFEAGGNLRSASDLATQLSRFITDSGDLPARLLG